MHSKQFVILYPNYPIYSKTKKKFIKIYIFLNLKFKMFIMEITKMVCDLNALNHYIDLNQTDSKSV